MYRTAGNVGTHRDVTSTLLGGSDAKKCKNGVLDLIRVVEVQSGANLAQDIFVGVLLRNLTANGGGDREGKKGEEDERLDANHDEDRMCDA